MLIGELSEISGVASKTIRYYEAIGLLEAPPRTGSGYRDYADDAVARLSFVRAAQSAGFTLGEIRGIVALRDRGVTPCGHVLDLLNAHRAEIERRVVELRRLGDELDRLATRAEQLDPADCDPRRVCHLLGET